MGGGDTTTQNQNQTSNSTTQALAAAQPMLTNLMGTLQAQGMNPTQAQTTAAGNLVTAANSAPNFAPAQTSITAGMLNGDPTGLLKSGNDTINARLGATADGANLDPMKNPAMRGWLDTIASDSSNLTNGQFAAAGRDLSPANSYSTARGIAAGEAPVLANQFNVNNASMTDAAKTLYNASTGTAGAIANNQQTGLSDSAALPGLLTAPAQAQLAAANTQAQLPLTVIQQLEQLGIPLSSAMGSTTTGDMTGTSTTQKQTDPMKAIIGGLLGGAGVMFGGPAGGMAGAGGLAGLLGGGGGGAGGIVLGGAGGPGQFLT